MDIKDPYLTQWLMTTPENFREHTRQLDTTSGWLVRYLFLYPYYRKQWTGFRQMTPDDIKRYTDVVGSLTSIKAVISGLLAGSNTTEIEMTMSDSAWKFFNNWQKDIETNALNNMDKIALSILGRLEIYVIKLAMLIELGKPNFTPEITEDTVKTSCRWITDYFLPVARRISMEVEWNESKNMQEKILGILKNNNGEMTLRDLMKKMHMRKSDILAELDSLVASEEITMTKSRKHKLSYIITLT